MLKLMLKKVVLILVPLFKTVLLLFYDKKYLQGRYFDNHHIAGCLWGIRSIWIKNILRLAKPMPFPTALTCVISNPNHLHFHPDDLNNFQSPGTYFQNFNGHIYLGKGCYIAPNVGIITANHKLDNLDEHDEGKDVILGEKCWVGMNCVILPGVELGQNTIVAAGSVVTKSFPKGNAIIGGVPAKVIKQLNICE